jgi:hypothetical protein
MRNFVFLLLLIIVAVFSASVSAQEYNCYCPEVTTYQSPVQYQQPQQYIAPRSYKPDPCNVVGTITPTLIVPERPVIKSVNALRVVSFRSLVDVKLKSGYLIDYENGLYRVYVDWRKAKGVNAEHKAQADGYCTYLYILRPSDVVDGLMETR